MYKNYGDKNFLEYGVLVEEEKENETYNMIICRPYSDMENKYVYGLCYVDITDSWIEKNEVMDYIGMSEENFEPIQFAIGCTEYYGLENFGLFFNDYTKGYTKEEIIEDMEEIKSCIDDEIYFE